MMTLRPGEVTLLLLKLTPHLHLVALLQIVVSLFPIIRSSPTNNRVSGLIVPRCPIAARKGLYTLHKRAIEGHVGFWQA